MIITDPIFLRQECEPVQLNEIADLHNLLELELKRSAQNGFPGIGLSAIQVGVLKKFAILRVPTTHGLSNIDLVNATVDRGFDPATFLDEGCLSFPDKKIKTVRFQEIVVTNNLIPPYTFTATGLLAVCCQHEIDHYNQKLMFDRQAK